ncbi:hypothetical protein [Burkholderia aenigmatica]|uniref:hypothetical protein n=1 Tax=Burkholderia aenigmatica TaxID=2015348 RepID=UPI002650E623|nr:hypothetical protein [Burkholderia aenigmatica]MDN7880870.1 hypothetical protein [Burkholderia aenigmatica]
MTTDWINPRASVGRDFAYPMRLAATVFCLFGVSREARARSRVTAWFLAGDRAAPPAPAAGIASSPFHRRRIFSSKKYRCKKATLQLSSYIVESQVFSHHEVTFYAGFCRV